MLPLRFPVLGKEIASHLSNNATTKPSCLDVKLCLSWDLCTLKLRYHECQGGWLCLRPRHKLELEGTKTPVPCSEAQHCRAGSEHTHSQRSWDTAEALGIPGQCTGPVAWWTGSVAFHGNVWTGWGWPWLPCVQLPCHACSQSCSCYTCYWRCCHRHSWGCCCCWVHSCWWCCCWGWHSCSTAWLQRERTVWLPPVLRMMNTQLVPTHPSLHTQKWGLFMKNPDSAHSALCMLEWTENWGGLRRGSPCFDRLLMTTLASAHLGKTGLATVND